MCVWYTAKIMLILIWTKLQGYQKKKKKKKIHPPQEQPICNLNIRWNLTKTVLLISHIQVYQPQQGLDFIFEVIIEKFPYGPRFLHCNTIATEKKIQAKYSSMSWRTNWPKTLTRMFKSWIWTHTTNKN